MKVESMLAGGVVHVTWGTGTKLGCNLTKERPYQQATAGGDVSTGSVAAVAMQLAR